MAITRASITRGPGSLTFGGQTWIDKDGIKADVNIARGNVPTSLHGIADEFITDKFATIGMTPIGRLDAARIAVLFPHQTPVIGASLCGASDSPLVIASRAGKSITFHNACLTGIPDLTLGADRTALGALELKAFLKDNTEWTDAAALYTLATAAFSEPTIDVSDIKRVKYTAAWGTLLTGIIAKDAWTISIGLELEDFTVSDYGTIDVVLKGVTVMAKCTPINHSEALLDTMKLQSTGAGIGASLRQSSDLTIAGTGGLTVILKDAALIEGPMSWNGTDLRAGEIAFVAQRSAGIGQLYSVAMTA